MAFGFLNDNKIKVFISSRCGKKEKDYEILRLSLKCLLEETGFISTYVFEEETASSIGVTDDYIMHLQQSDVILFLIDNKKKDCTEGITNEWIESKKLQKKSIVIFCNDSQKEETFIQYELKAKNALRYYEITDRKDFITKGYKAVINDIISVYRLYCNNRLIRAEYYEENEININNFTVESINHTLEKNVIKEFTFIKNDIKLLNGISWGLNENESLNNLKDKYSGVSDFLKVILCDLKYTSDIKERIVKEISNLHTLDKEFIEKRWECIDRIYNDDLDKALSILDQLYEDAQKYNLDTWIINDILIDKRNLKILKVNMCKEDIHKINEQDKLSNNKHVLYYPIIDRISNEINFKILNEIDKVNLKKPSTVSYGTGINTILEKIAEYYICAIYYGSYTHMRLVRQLLKETFFNFYKLYSYNPWGFKALKYAILDEDSKMIKHISNRKSDIISTCSSSEIGQLYFMIDKIPSSYERKSLKLITFESLGYYFNENDYKKIEKDMYYIINGWVFSEKPEYFLRDKIFSTLKNNNSRMDNQEIMDILLRIYDKKTYRIIDQILEIFGYLDFEEIKEKSYDRCIDIIVELVNNPDDNEVFNNYYLENSLIVLGKQKYKKSNELEKLVKEKMTDFYVNYKLEVKKESLNGNEIINKHIQQIKTKNKTQGKYGIYAMPADNSEIIIGNILKYFQIDIKENNLLNNLVAASKETLLNSRLPVSDKVNTIKILINLKYITEKDNINFDWNGYYKELLKYEEDILKSYADHSFDNFPAGLLPVSWVLYKFNNEEINIDELLKVAILFDDGELYHRMLTLEFINFFAKYGNCNNKYVYIILSQFILRCAYNSENDEDRCKAIDCMFILDNKGYIDMNLFEFYELSENCSSLVKLSIIYNIKRLDDYSKYKVILEKYKVDNHYLVRERSRKLLEMI